MLKTIVFTMSALVAFAANSILCRIALGTNLIDAASFTILRLLSGTMVLFLIIVIRYRHKTELTSKGSWAASLMLFIYASTFSFAYTVLDTGTGALILFAAVQITMILLSLISGNRLHIIEWTGVILAFSGFVYLVLPNITSPSASGFLLMTLSGVAWGLYTLKGRESKSPVTDTAYNFIKTVPLVVVLHLLTMHHATYSTLGILLAVLSGGIASGLGYTAWYIALAGLTATQAAVLQLLVPVIAALGGMTFLSEILTLRLSISALMIMGGILMVVLGRYYFVPTHKYVKEPR
ncbi:MAG: DMT family transporter [Methylococcales bacterium]